MLVSLSPRATQQLLLRSYAAAAPSSARSSLFAAAAKATTPWSNSSSSGSSATMTRQVAARLFYSTCSSRASVLPSVRQRRPVVRGEAVAFHVKDLDHTTTNNRGARPLAHSARSALQQPDYDDDDDDLLLYTNKREYESDMIVVLDMDECLIHSQFLTNNPGAKFYAHQVARSASSNNKDESTKARVDSFRFNLADSGDLVQVNKRPFLEEFLQAVTQKYETHIYTAAMEIYAKPILDSLDPDGDRFAKRWYRESCDLDKTMGAYVKNLARLPLNTDKINGNRSNSSNGLTYEQYLANTNSSSPTNNDKSLQHLRRVVLVDNNPLSFLANPTNGILVSSFYNDPADKTLPAVLDLLQELDPLDDVRPTLDARFGLKTALSEIQGNRRQQQQKQWTK